MTADQIRALMEWVHYKIEDSLDSEHGRNGWHNHDKMVECREELREVFGLDKYDL